MLNLLENFRGPHNSIESRPIPLTLFLGNKNVEPTDLGTFHYDKYN